jgi:hypothetical protein
MQIDLVIFSRFQIGWCNSKQFFDTCLATHNNVGSSTMVEKWVRWQKNFMKH